MIETMPHPTHRSVAAERLRATFRLIFDGGTADQLTAMWRRDDDDPLSWGLRRPARAAAALYARRRLAAWLRAGSAKPTGRPLSPQSGVPAGSAIALALHLGLGIDTAAIAEVQKSTPERVSADLQRARRALDPERLAGCREGTALIGRYRDQRLSADERLALIQHLQSCAECRAALERARQVDERLIAEIDRIQAALRQTPAATPSRFSALAFLPWVPVAGVLTSVLLLVSGVLAAGWIADSKQAPVPLLEHADQAGLRGWLLVNSPQNGLEAVNLGSGERRPLRAGPGEAWGQTLLSPGARYLALSGSASGATTANVLEVRRVSGSALRRWNWDDAGVQRSATAWLDDATLLLVEQPASISGEAQEATQARQEQESRLVTLNVVTGEEQQIFQGSVMSAVPSPDKSLLALTRAPDSRSSGQTLELRPLQWPDEAETSADPDSTPGAGAGQVGDPITVLEHRFIATDAPIWSSDSSRVYITMISDEVVPETATPGPDGTSETPVADRIDLASIDRAGTLTRLTNVASGEAVRLASVSPEGSHVAFMRGRQGTDAPLWFGWIMDTATGNTIQLDAADPSFTGLGSAIWSPDGEAVLLAGRRPFFLPQDDANSRFGTLSNYDLVAFKANGERREIAHRQLSNATSIAWLPDEALPAGQSNASLIDAVQFGEPAPVEGVTTGLTVDANSQVSPDGRRVLLRDPGRNSTVIWNRVEGAGRSLGAASRDASWLPDGGVIAVGSVSSRTAGPSRITITSPTSLDRGRNSDIRRFDPARIGASTDRLYARPLLSPDGTTMSFFVVDQREARVALWLARQDRAPSPVAEWTLEAHEQLELSLVAVWASPDALLVAVPGKWQHGLPQEVELRRLTVDQTGGTSIETLTTLRSRGNERGVVLQELLISPDRAQLAYRLQHFTSWEPASGSFDTVSVTRAANIDAPIELSRGGRGAGLAWSPDSRWLTAGIKGQLALLSVDGLTARSLAPDGGSAAAPIWAGPNEIWFALDLGDGPKTAGVRLE